MRIRGGDRFATHLAEAEVEERARDAEVGDDVATLPVGRYEIEKGVWSVDAVAREARGVI